MTGFNKVEIMMTSLPVFDLLTFWAYLALYRIFKTFLDDKRVASSLEKGRLFEKYTLAQRIFYLSGKDSSRKNPTVPEVLGLDEDKTLMTSLLCFDDVILSGWTCPFQKYIILTRSYFCNFLKKNRV